MRALRVGAAEVGEGLEVDIGDVLDDDLEAASFICISGTLFRESDDDLALSYQLGERAQNLQWCQEDRQWET